MIKILNEDSKHTDIQVFLGAINVTDLLAYSHGVRIRFDDEAYYIKVNNSSLNDWKYMGENEIFSNIKDERKNVPDDKRWNLIDEYFRS